MIDLDLLKKEGRLNACPGQATDLADISVARPSRTVSKQVAELSSEGVGPTSVSTFSKLLADLSFTLVGRSPCFFNSRPVCELIFESMFSKLL